MKKHRYGDTVREHCALINDLQLSVFIPRRSDVPRDVNEVSAFLHTHSYIEIFVCTGGELSIAADNEMLKLLPNDIAFVPADCSHTAVSGNNSAFFTIGIIGLRVDSKEAGSAYGELSDFFELDGTRIYRRTENVRESLKEIFEKEYSPSSALPIIKTAAALAELSKFGCEESKTTLLEKKSTSAKDVMRFLIIEDIINGACSERLDTDDIAKRLYITRRHLDRIVKKRYGRSLRELVAETRIKLAIQFLCDTDLSLEVIAQRIGFGSTLSFRNNFLKYVGVSPSEYRRKKRGV